MTHSAKARDRCGAIALALRFPSALATVDVEATQTGFPARSIRLTVAQSARGSADFVARTYAQRLAELVGQQIVIDNRPGSAGIVSTELVVNAPPDGYTLLLAPTSHAINPNFVVKLPYDARRDFTWAKVTQAAGLNVH